MTPRSPLVTKLIRYGLIGAGASAILSAAVNIVATLQLIGPAEEQSLGITRNEIIGWYLGLVVIGGLLIFLGLRQRK